MTTELFRNMPWFAWPVCIVYGVLLTAAIVIFWRYRRASRHQREKEQ